MRKPNLFLIGVPRSGTTSISHYLSRHPEVFFVYEKEPMFFASDIPDRPRIKTLGEYENLFKDAKNQKWVGEKSSFYLYSENALKKLKEYSPKCKLIIALRNPIEVITSWHNNFSKSIWNNAEDTSDLKLALEKEKIRRKNSKEKFKPYFYTEMVNYYKYLKKYLKRYGKENIKIIFLEDIKNNPQKVCNEICEFLEIEKLPIELEVKNKGSVDTGKKSVRIISFINSKTGIITKLRSIIPSRFRMRFKESLRKDTKKPMEKELEEKIKKKLRPNIEKLEKLLKKDLSSWK